MAVAFSSVLSPPTPPALHFRSKGFAVTGFCTVEIAGRSAALGLCSGVRKSGGSVARASSNVEEGAAQYDEVRADGEKEDLAAKLAVVEAEAKALRKELALRSGGKELDLSKLNPATPEKRIDGIGYRETLLSLSNELDGEQKPNKWGLSEAELFLSKGAPTEGSGVKSTVVEAETKDIVNRRLLIALGLSLLALGLAFLKLPAGFIRPSKPLFIYLVPILQLRDQLRNIETTDSDAKVVLEQLQSVSSSANVLKETLLRAAAWLDGSNAERASSLAYDIFEFLDQVDYNKYYDSFGKPSASQQLEFLRFSLQSVKAAREKLEEFFSYVPEEALVAASSQLRLRS